jgi:hypothetical protein
MTSKPDLTNIANQDWSNFDFTRWNLEGLKLDTQPATLAGWVRDVTLSPQGPQKFAAGLTAVKSAVMQSLQEQTKAIQGRLSAIDGELTKRVTATRSQISSIEENIRIAAVPSVATPDPESFQVAAKVLDQTSRLGLPGLQVRLYDTQSPKVTLASATTDQNGNALLKLNRQQIDTLAKSGAVLTTEVLTPANKSVFTGGAVPPPKLNETGTIMAPLAASADLAPHLNTAAATIAQQQALLSAVTKKANDLQSHYQQIKSDLQQQLQNVQAIIADLQPST